MSSRIKLPSEIPIEEYPPPETFINEALSCVKEAGDKGIILRIMGGMGICLHSEEYKQLWEKLSRLGEKVFTDIDFASYGKFRSKVFEFFRSRGYDIDKKLHMHYGMKRHMYFGGTVPMIEVFFDKLEMNHTISFNKRLEADSPTLPLSELLLQKLQIVKINEKDIKDAIVLLRAHDVGTTDKETINLEAFAQAGLTSDWGFYYTTKTNLQKIKEFTNGCNVLNEMDKKIICERIDKISNFIEQKPKSLNWKLRAKVGPKKKWYNDVEDWIFFRSESQ
ncbi:MAG: hypothetical protein QXN63_03740 [Candidatus Bathyarchaeia archaeon]